MAQHAYLFRSAAVSWGSAALAFLIALGAPSQADGKTTNAFAQKEMAAACVLSVQDRSSLLDEINELRAQYGLGALTPNGSLSASALDHARDIAHLGRMSHEGSDGSMFSVRAERRGYAAFPRAENIAYNQRNVPRVVKAWRESPPHLETLLDEGADHVGFGRACGNDARPYWVMVVGG